MTKGGAVEGIERAEVNLVIIGVVKVFARTIRQLSIDHNRNENENVQVRERRAPGGAKLE